MWILLYLTFSLISPFEASPLTTQQPRHGNDSSSKVKPMNEPSKQAFPIGSTPILEQKNKTSTIAAGLKKIETTKNADMDKGAIISTGINTVMKTPQNSNHDPQNTLHNQKSLEHPMEDPKNYSASVLSVKSKTTNKISTENKRQMKQQRGINDFPSKEVTHMNVQNKNAVMDTGAIISTGTNTLLKNEQNNNHDPKNTLHTQKSLEHPMEDSKNYSASVLSVKSKTTNKISTENKRQMKMPRRINDFPFKEVRPMNVQNKNSVMDKEAKISTGINTVIKNQQEKEKQNSQKTSRSEKSLEHHKKPGNYNTSDFSVKSENISSKLSVENKNQIKTRQKKDVHAFLSNVMSNQNTQGVSMDSVHIPQRRNETLSTVSEESMKKEKSEENTDMNIETKISSGTNTELKKKQKKDKRDTQKTSHNHKSLEQHQESANLSTSELPAKSETTTSKINTESKNTTIRTENHQTNIENNVTSNLNKITVGINEQHQESPAKKTIKINLGNNDHHNLVPDKETTFTDLPNSNSTSQFGNQSIVNYPNKDEDKKERKGHHKEGGMPTDRTTGAQSTISHGLMLIHKNALITSSDIPIFKENKKASNKTEEDHHRHHEVTKISNTTDGNIYSTKPKILSDISSQNLPEMVMSTKEPTRVSKKESTSTLSVLTRKAEQSVNEDLAKNKISQVGNSEETSIKSSDEKKKPTVSSKSTEEALDLKPPFLSVVI